MNFKNTLIEAKIAAFMNGISEDLASDSIVEHFVDLPQEQEQSILDALPLEKVHSLLILRC